MNDIYYFMPMGPCYCLVFVRVPPWNNFRLGVCRTSPGSKKCIQLMGLKRYALFGPPVYPTVSAN